MDAKREVMAKSTNPIGLGQRAKDIADKMLLGVDKDLDTKRVLAHVPHRDGCLWHRIFRPLSYLKKKKTLDQFETTNMLVLREWLGVYPRPFNVLINQRIFGPVPLAVAKSFGFMYILECDDDYWSITKKNPAHKWLKEKRQFLPYFAATIPHAWGVVVTTQTLKERFEDLGAKRIFVVPNGLNFDDYKNTPINRSGTIRLGWFGSAHHVDDLEQITNVIKRLKAAHPQLEVVFMGWCPPQLKGIVEYRESVPTEEYEQEIRQLRLDIAMAPLVDSKFNKSKSNLKFLECAAMGVPLVASNVDTYGCIEDGDTGFLVDNTNEWFETIDMLIKNAPMRARVGHNAWKYARMNFDFSVTTKKWLDVIKENLEFQKSTIGEAGLPRRLTEATFRYNEILKKSKFYNKIRTKMRRKGKWKIK